MALAHFSNLTELELFGGCFYDHKIVEVLETKGFRLRSLTLTSVKQIDYRGLLQNINSKNHAVLILQHQSV